MGAVEQRAPPTCLSSCLLSLRSVRPVGKPRMGFVSGRSPIFCASAENSTFGTDALLGIPAMEIP
jgi:hypothetical protein